MKDCTQCGKCCQKAPCQIPVMHVDALRYILVNEFEKPVKVNGLDIVSVMFRYKEETLPSGQIHGYFLPLPKTGKKCMWLEKVNGKNICKLFWNKTAEQLVGFAEQVIGKGKGCTLSNPQCAPVIPMIFNNGVRAICMEKAKNLGEC